MTTIIILPIKWVAEQSKSQVSMGIKEGSSVTKMKSSRSKMMPSSLWGRMKHFKHFWNILKMRVEKRFKLRKDKLFSNKMN